MNKNMKKIYVCPTVVVEDATVATSILAASGVKSEDFGIDYGGVDVGGDMNPSVKEQSWDAIWD